MVRKVVGIVVEDSPLRMPLGARVKEFGVMGGFEGDIPFRMR